MFVFLQLTYFTYYPQVPMLELVIQRFPSLVCMYHILFIHLHHWTFELLLPSGYWEQCLCEHGCVNTFESPLSSLFRYIPSSETTRSCLICFETPYCFCYNCTILHSHQHKFQLLHIFTNGTIFYVKAILTGVKWHLTVVSLTSPWWWVVLSIFSRARCSFMYHLWRNVYSIL
jgi:hypothetical protein